MLFTECVKVIGNLGIIHLSVLCDTDIQGDENQETFKRFWQNLQFMLELTSRLGLTPVIDSMAFNTEQQEPLLLFPDYVAGCLHSELAFPEVKLPPGIDRETLKYLSGKLLASTKVFVDESDFKHTYAEIWTSRLLQNS